LREDGNGVAMLVAASTKWEIGDMRTIADFPQSTLMYVEAEAKMDSFQAQDGSQRTALNLLQRKLPLHQIPRMHLLTKLQATSRPSQDPVSRTAAAAPRARPTQPTSPSAALALPRGLAF
jgi:hypothetical protein